MNARTEVRQSSNLRPSPGRFLVPTVPQSSAWRGDGPMNAGTEVRDSRTRDRAAGQRERVQQMNSGSRRWPTWARCPSS
jgi:hypothetical protein